MLIGLLDRNGAGLPARDFQQQGRRPLYRPLLVRRVHAALEALAGIRRQPPALTAADDGVGCEVRGFEEDVRSLSAH